MEPNTNETQVNSEQGIPSSSQAPQSPKNNLKWIILAVIFLICTFKCFRQPMSKEKLLVI